MEMFILSQVLGVIALILVCISYFVKVKTKFLIMQIVANVFYAGSFLVQSSWVGGIITLISTVRCVYIFFCEKYNFKYSIYFLPIFIVCYVITGVFLYSGVADIIPIFTGTLFTIAFSLKNLQVVRYLCLLPNAGLVAYNILCKTYANAVLDLIEVTVLIVAIIKFSRKKNDSV